MKSKNITIVCDFISQGSFQDTNCFHPPFFIQAMVLNKILSDRPSKGAYLVRGQGLKRVSVSDRGTVFHFDKNQNPLIFTHHIDLSPSACPSQV